MNEETFSEVYDESVICHEKIWKLMSDFHDASKDGAEITSNEAEFYLDDVSNVMKKSVEFLVSKYSKEGDPRTMDPKLYAYCIGVNETISSLSEFKEFTVTSGPVIDDIDGFLKKVSDIGMKFLSIQEQFVDENAPTDVREQLLAKVKDRRASIRVEDLITQ